MSAFVVQIFCKLALGEEWDAFWRQAWGAGGGGGGVGCRERFGPEEEEEEEEEVAVMG